MSERRHGDEATPAGAEVATAHPASGSAAAPGSAEPAPPSAGSLLAAPARAEELRGALRELPSWSLTPRQLCDLELLMTGAFAPLTGFQGRAACATVCRDLRLPDGRLWPIPITLDLTAAVAEQATRAGALALRDPEGLPLAVLQLAEAWEHDREAEAEAVYGTLDPHHPGVHHLLRRTNNVAVGGVVEGLRLPPHYDFLALRETPAEVREDLARRGWRRVVAFQTRNPLHRAHFELTVRAAREADAHLLLHPVVGMTQPGDLDHYTRVRCYQALLGRYPPDLAKLSLLPLAMRMAGPREALLHALVRRNYGCSHFVVGRDHAGPGRDRAGRPFYGPYEAQQLVNRYQAELGIEMVPFREMVYDADRARYVPEDELPSGRGGTAKPRVLRLSGSELRQRLAEGAELPEWFTFPEVAAELRRTHRPRSAAGFTIFMTGLSGAGKSTLARVLQVKLLEHGGRPVTLLDGDLVRHELSSELGFSKEDRDKNVRRIGFVASEITRNGGIALCAPIAPYDALRRELRERIAPLGGFVLVWVATPLAVCEERDVKGLYARARAGLLPAFTGVSDPYEPPADAEVVVDAATLSPGEAAERVLGFLRRAGYLAADGAPAPASEAHGALVPATPEAPARSAPAAGAAAAEPAVLQLAALGTSAHSPPPSQSARQARVCVVMPAYNAERTLERTYRDLPLEWVDDVVLVDDASRDRTVAIARALGLHTVVHPRNRGYGGNQKSCYRAALARGADVVVMVHPDHQYDPGVIPALLAPLLAGECDAVFGSRMLGGRPLEGGMPKWKYFANIFLTALANATFYVFLSEYHSGLRAYSRRYLEAVDLEANSEDFVFDTEIIAQGMARGMRIREIPIATRYFPEASQIGFWRSVRYGCSVLAVLVRYKLHQKGIRSWRLLG